MFALVTCRFRHIIPICRSVLTYYIFLLFSLFYFNTAILLIFVFANGGRHDWIYDWGSLLLACNLVPLTIDLVRTRVRRNGRGPLFWLGLIIGPWFLFDFLFVQALFNPSHSTIYNNLFSPMRLLEYNTAWPTTPNPERSRLFLQMLIGLQLMTLQLIYGPTSRKQIRRCLGAVFLTGATLAIIGGLMKLTGTPLFLWTFEFREPAAYATFFYKNHWAYFALLAAGCGMALFHSTYANEKHSGHLPEKSIGIAFLILVLLISIPLAEARGATLLATPLALVFVVSLTQPLRKHRPKLAAMLALLALVIISLGIYQITRPQLERRVLRSQEQIESFTTENRTKDIMRLAAYRDAWTIFKERPVWGWGIGSFIHIHPIYAGPEFYPPGYRYPIVWEFPHSDYLQALAEIGILGSLLLFLPFGTLLIGILKKTKLRNKISLWLLGATGAVTVAASFDMVLIAPAIAMGVLLITSSGYAYALQSLRRQRGSPS